MPYPYGTTEKNKDVNGQSNSDFRTANRYDIIQYHKTKRMDEIMAIHSAQVAPYRPASRSSIALGLLHYEHLGGLDDEINVNPGWYRTED